MELILIAVVLLGALGVYTLFAKWFSHKDDDDLDFDPYQLDLDESSRSLSGVDSSTIPPIPSTGHQFTLAELRRAPEGQYSWDETGCVFEINPDGSVTIVGRFDPAELLVDPGQELYDSLIENGLLDMLPRMWSLFIAIPHDWNDFDEYMFMQVADGDLLLTKDLAYNIDDIRNVSFEYRTIDDMSVVVKRLRYIKKGIMILMPQNEQEYVLALGAVACLKRILGETFRARILWPASLGAFWTAVKSGQPQPARYSYAFGIDEDYMCCNMTMDNNVGNVTQLLTGSVIVPKVRTQALTDIAKGAFIEGQIMYGSINEYLFIEMVAHPMSFLLRENGRVVKVYDLISTPMTIPTRQSQKQFFVGPNQTLSFLVGQYELVEDVMSLANVGPGLIDASIELDADMTIFISINANGTERRINIGELIG